MPELKRLITTRIVSTKAALDALSVPSGTVSMRTAPDELLLLPAATVTLDDAHAIVERDGGFAGVWLNSAEANHLFERAVEWEIPSERPVFAQGAVAGIPAKLWLEQDSVLLICPAVYAEEMEERIA